MASTQALQDTNVASRSKNAQVLRPKHDALYAEGIISYTKSQRAFNSILIKKPFLMEFPQLSERRSKFGYRMIMHRSFSELSKAIKDLEKKGEQIPICLWFYRLN